MKDEASANETVLVDTNILVYAYDTFDIGKNKKCRRIAEAGFSGETKLAVSNQILAELFIVLTTKLEKPFSTEDAGDIVSGIADSSNWLKLNYTHETVGKAIEISKSFKTSLWDSLIIATAIENNIGKIYTEDIRGFRKMPTINVVNPILH